MDPSNATPDIRVAALYRFCRIAAPDALRKPIAAFCRGHPVGHRDEEDGRTL